MKKNSIKNGTMRKKITIVILEDVPIIISAMRIELDKPGIEISAASDNVNDFLEKIKKHQPDIAFIDLRIDYDYNSGFLAIEQAKLLSPSTKFIIFTSYDDLPEFDRALNLGVKAFITKNIHQRPLDEIVRIVYTGGQYFGELLDQYVGKLSDKPGLSEPELSQKHLTELFSKREIEVLSLLEEGLSPKEIAKKISISPNTIKSYTQSIRKKFGVKTTKEAVRAYVIHKSKK